MKNPWVKGVSVLIVAGVAVGVNVLGYTKTKQAQQAQRIEQAVTTISNQQKQLETIQTAIDAAYEDETQDLLKPNVTVESMTKIENNLNRLKVTAADFSLSAKDLPAEVESLGQQKAQLQTQLQIVSDKVKLQQQLLKLFTNESINFQEAINDVIIQPDATLKEIETIREAVTLLPGEQWQAMMKEYLDYAQAQVSRANDLRTSFEEMLDDGKVTDAATYERYLTAADSITQVRNPELKETFQTQLNQIGEQLGFGSIYYSQDETYE